MDHDLTLRDWLTRASAFVTLLATVATANAYLNGGMDEVVKLHNPNSVPKALITVLLFGCIGWLLYIAGGYDRLIERKWNFPTIAAAKRSNPRPNLMHVKSWLSSSSRSSASILAITVAALVSFLGIEHFTKDEPAYLYVPATRSFTEFTSMARCQQVAADFGQSKKLCKLK
jgi:drug/metabolite transporter (DMT)-like permease